MRKNFIKHDNLRKTFEEIFDDDVCDDDVANRLINELKHSCLIIAADINDNSVNFRFLTLEDKNYGVLFSDMDEFRKCFNVEECESNFFGFEIYKDLIEGFNLDGYILNPESEALIIKKELFELFDTFPDDEYSFDEAYTSEELKNLKDSINNNELEDFITNSANYGRYEELFEIMSKSTMLTLMLSDENLDEYAEDNVISMAETGPLGYLYIDELGGSYATVYTSESKIANVNTTLNKYSQIVNFSQMANFILNDDMDGIIINPNSDNVLLTRDVLLKYSSLLEKTCNDERLNSAILHMFIMEE